MSCGSSSTGVLSPTCVRVGGVQPEWWQLLWARTGEKACRLALIYAASRGIENLRIDTPAVEWACEVADYTTRLFQSQGGDCIADSKFQEWCQSVAKQIQKYAARNTGLVSHSDLIRRVPMTMLDKRQRSEVIDYLTEAGKIEVMQAGRAKFYRRLQ